MNETNDNSLGPQLRDEFDFTLLFEEAILTILPSALLLSISPLYIYRLLRKPLYAKPGILLWIKLAVATVLLAFQIANLVFWSQPMVARTKTSIAAAVFSCISSLCIGVLLLAKHRYSLRPSTLLSIYLSSTLLFDIAKARSLFIRPGLHINGSFTVVILSLKLVILFLEEVPKRSLFYGNTITSTISQEEISGFWNRSVFWWLNSTLLAGYRSLLTVGNLEDIGSKFDSENLLSILEDAWGPIDKTSTYCLLKAIFLAFARQILVVILPRLCFTGFSFAQPFLFPRIVDAVGDTSLPGNVIGGLIGATALVYLGIALSKAYYTHLVFQFITMLRGALVAIIFKKALSLEGGAAAASAAVTLMSTDIDGIAMGIEHFHDVWANIIELGVGIYLLARIVSGASFLVAIPGLVTSVASFYIAQRMGPARMAWNEKIQKRVSTTSEVLAQLKGIKMMGLGPSVFDHIQGLRVVEMEFSKKFRTLNVTTHTIATFSNAITPVLIIAGGLFWTQVGGSITATQAFTTLSIITLVSHPLAALLLAYPMFTSILGCVSRIQSFLLLAERAEQRLIMDEHRAEGSSSQGSGHGHNGYELQRITTKQKFSELSPGDSMIQIQGASFAVGKETEPILHDINLNLTQSSLTMVVGPVGSGKSTLLRAILGEAYLCQGSVHVKHADVAYCDQTSWLQNTSIRDNVLGQEQLDLAWYETIMHACLLDEDMRQLPEGDQSHAGSGGSNLSGGQRQRVALARAVYSRKQIVLLDDVFSALDRKTANASFSRLLGEEGILRKCRSTVILITHIVEQLAWADTVVTLDTQGRMSTRKNIDRLQRTENVTETIKPTERVQESERQVQVGKTPTGMDNNRALEHQVGDLTLYGFYLQSIGKLPFAMFLLLAAAFIIATKMPEIWIRIWLETDPENNWYFAGYAAWAVLSCLTAFSAVGFFLLKLVPKSAENLHRLLLDTVIRASLWYFSMTDTGTILNRFSQDMTLVNQVLPMSVFELTCYTFVILCDVAIIASGAQYTAATIPFFLVALYFLQRYYLRTSRQMRHLDLEAKSPIYTQFTEIATGVQHIRAFHWQSKFLAHSLRLLNYSQKPYYLMFCIQRWLTLVLDISVLCIATLLVAFALNFTHTTTQGAVGLALINIIGFSQSLSELINSWTKLETSLGAIARLKKHVADTPVEDEPYEPAQPPEDWPTRGKIELSHVSAKYNIQDAAEKFVLDDVSLVIQPGQKVGIVGRTGSGKSSLILTLLHLIEFSGSILIDDVEITAITRQHLRSRITTITQDAIYLPGSFRANLYPFSPEDSGSVSDGDMIAALSRVGLWEVIRARDGLDADLATIGLSHGQRQLLCLARALLHHTSTRSRIILMDEATSSVDRDTEACMQTIMTEAFSGCTTVVIAHRVDIIRDADLVVELHAGKVIGVTGSTTMRKDAV